MATTLPRIKVSDVTGLRSGDWQPKSGQESILALVEEMAQELGLPATDSSGQPIVYGARRESDGMSLAASELVDEVLGEQETVFLEPDINAG
jgi:hypothetical protein